MPVELWDGFAKKEISGEELKSQMETIKTLLIMLLEVKGL